MSRFIKISHEGQQLPEDAAEFDAVLDTTTNLMWSAGDVSEDELTFAKAEKATGSLQLAGFSDWRLPSDVELLSIVDRSRYSPAIDTTFFPTAKSDWYWTTKETAWSSDHVWIVYFGNGSVISLLRSASALARAVRAAAPAGQ